MTNTDRNPSEQGIVLVLDRRGPFAEAVASAAAELPEPPEVLRAPRTTKALEAVEQTEPDVLVASPEEFTQTGLRRLAQVHRANPRLVILLSPNGKRLPVRDTAACGAQDVLPYPSTPSRMRVKLRRALETASELRPEGVPEPQPAPEAQPAPEPRPQTPTADGHVLTVTSASGGCGKTFYATNIAAYLAQATRRRVLLVDLDLQFGEVAVSLRLRPEVTIADLIDAEDVSEELDDHVVGHDAGYDVLCAPKDPVAAERVGPRETTAVLEAARARYDYVVVDTPPSINEVVLAAFDLSGSLVVMATPDVPSLRNMRVFLGTLEKLKLPSTDVSIVLNKAERGTGIDLDRVEQAFPQGFRTVLPYAKEVTRSLNLGAPVVSAEPGAPISQRFFEGARNLYPPAEGAELPWEGIDHDVSWLRRILKGVRR